MTRSVRGLFVACTTSLATLLSLGSSHEAQAIEISDGTGYSTYSQGRQRTIRLTGELEPGDTRKVERYFKSVNPGQSRPPRRRFELSFKVGDYGEALKLASFFRDRALSTIVGPGDVCRGPCGIAFMGGAAPDGDGYIPPSRCLLPGGELSLGLPAFSSDPRFAQVSDSGRAVRQQAFLFFVSLLRITTDHVWPEPVTRALFDAGAGGSVEITTDLYNKTNFRWEAFYPGNPCRTEQD